MWRDRTNLYISYRQSFAHHPSKKPRYPGAASDGFTVSSSQPEESRRLIPGGADDDGDAIIEMDVLPPRWVDVQDEVTELLASIAQQSVQLDKLHQKHLLPGFGDEDIRKQEEGAIERLTQDITRGFHECQRAVQKIEAMVRDAKAQGIGVSAGDETMAKNIQISLAARVQEASAGFRKKQSTYLKKLRGLESGTSPFDRTPTPMQNPYTDPSLMESDADKSFSQSTLMQTSQRRTGQNDAAIEQREREINDIAKGIIELSDIFRELQTMIIDQGTMLDRIDYNVEQMGTEVKAADKELNVATNYQRRTTKRKVLLLLVIIIAGLIIILLVKPKNHSSSSSEARSLPRSSPPPPPPSSSTNNLFPRTKDETFRRRKRRYSSELMRITRDEKWIIDPDRFR